MTTVARPKKKWKKKGMNCSDTFERAFNSGVSSSVSTCHCGKTYYDASDNKWDWGEGELEDLEKSKDAFPLDYSVDTMRIGGDFLVFGCDCGRAKMYEDFIISHARQLAEYLNLYAKNLMEKAKEATVGDAESSMF